jgi:hypothetical protein
MSRLDILVVFFVFACAAGLMLILAPLSLLLRFAGGAGPVDGHEP